MVADCSLRLKAQHGWDNTRAAAYSNEFTGYIPPVRVLPEGGHEAGEALRGQDHPGPFAEAVEQTVIRTVGEPIRRTGGSPAGRH